MRDPFVCAVSHRSHVLAYAILARIHHDSPINVEVFSFLRMNLFTMQPHTVPQPHRNAHVMKRGNRVMILRISNEFLAQVASGLANHMVECGKGSTIGSQNVWFVTMGHTHSSNYITIVINGHLNGMRPSRYIHSRFEGHTDAKIPSVLPLMGQSFVHIQNWVRKTHALVIDTSAFAHINLTFVFASASTRNRTQMKHQRYISPRCIRVLNRCFARENT